MARTPDRRPGFSRRAQNRIFTGFVVALAGVLVGAGFLVAALFNPGLMHAPRAAAAEAARPVGVANAHAREAGQSVFGAIAAYFDAGRQNAALKREVAVARADAQRMQALVGENARLKALLGVKDAAPGHVAIAARLIGSTATSMRRYAVIAAGFRQGVGVGEPVRSAAGLVGRVLEVGPDTARVLLVTDPENIVPVRRARDGLPALVQGLSDGRVSIRLISSGVASIAKGDVFVTSGSGGLYPPDVPVAMAVEPQRDGAVGLLASDPADADFVLVEPVFQQPALQMLATPPVEPVKPSKKKKKKAEAAG